MKKLYKFYWNCGRQGDVTGLFISDEQTIKETIGKEVYFGEILGKHSEVFGTLDEVDLEVIDIPENVVDILEEHLGSTLSGYNPLSYLREDQQ